MGSGWICKICGKEFTSKWALLGHIAGSGHKAQKKCKYCGKSIPLSHKNFCSHKCQGKFMFSRYGIKPKGMKERHHTEKAKKKMSKSHKGKQVGKNNPNWKGGKSYHTCEICGKEFKAPGKRRFCSMKCKNKWQRKYYKNKANHPSYGRKRSKETRQKVSKARKGKLTGKQNPAWKGGISFEPYGKEFNNKLKEKVRKRDNYTCQNCGVKETELNKKLDIHHIDRNKHNNSLENLIALCHDCHLEEHGKDY